MPAPSKSPGYSRRYAKMHRNGVRLSVDSAVAVRMIRGLACIGYTHQQISTESGVGSKRYIGQLANGGRGSLYLATDKALRETYQRLHMSPLDTTSARKAKAYARKAGWFPPAAYEDITDLSITPTGARQ